MAERAGGIEVSFNLISYEDVQGTPLAEMPLEDFERPVMTAVRTQFLTARAAARHMIAQGSGVILTFAASDLARTMTATSLNITCGRVAD